MVAEQFALGLPGRRVVDQVVERAVVVERLREIAAAFLGGRHAVVLNRVAGRARTVLVGVEEEQLVVAAGLADRAADHVAPVARLVHGPGLAVQPRLPGVRVPVRVPLVIVELSAEAVRAAARDRRDLQAARAAVLGLIPGGEQLDLGDRGLREVQTAHDAVVAGVDGGNAVDHDVVLTAAAGALPVLVLAPRVDADLDRDEVEERVL